MLGTLLESNARRQRRRASLMASVAVHTVMIGGALAATASARSGERLDRGLARQRVIYTERRTVTAAKQPAKQPAVRERLKPPGVEAARFALRFTLDSLVRRTIDDETRRIDASDMLGIDTTSVACIGYCPERRAGDSTTPFDATPATLATVDRPAAIHSPPRPRYPEQLRAAGVTGRVVVRLVVDTLGRVELGTVAVLEASHDLFAGAVRAVLPTLRFTPAEAGGRRVRMLVDLPFEFMLNER